MDPMQRRPDWDALMHAAVGGDAKSYKVLLDTLPGVLRSVTRRGYARFGVEPNDVEDVVQEVLLAIHLKRHTWKVGAPVAPWIMAIVFRARCRATRTAPSLMSSRCATSRIEWPSIEIERTISRCRGLK